MKLKYSFKLGPELQLNMKKGFMICWEPQENKEVIWIWADEYLNKNSQN